MMRSASAISLVAWLVAVAGVAQPPVDTDFGEELSVTSVDLWVGAPSGRFHDWWSGGKGKRPSFDGVELVIAGTAVEITAVEPSRRSSESAPWQILVWFDAALSEELSLRWAARILAEQVEALTSRGEVQVVVADPEPRVLVEAGADRSVLVGSLSQLSLFGDAEDVLRGHRESFLEEIEAADSEIDEDERSQIATIYAAAEVELILRQQDRMLEWLEETAEPGRRRVLVYVGRGWERTAARFYDLEEGEGLSPLLERESSQWVRAVASYDWTAVVLLPQERRPPLKRGVTVGRWRFGFGFPFIAGAYEEARDPELARSFVTLGDSELAAGDLIGAEEAYRKAVYHFYGDGRTRQEQAAVELKLAEVLLLRNEPGSARLHLFNAMALDPTLEAEPGVRFTPLLEAEAVLEELVAETGGLMVRRGPDLLEALVDLDARRRLSFQLRGLSRGEVLPLALVGDDPGAVYLHRRWVRSGTPERVAHARLRDFLRDAADEPIQRSVAGERDSAGVAVLSPAAEFSRPRRVFGYTYDSVLQGVESMQPDESRAGRWTAPLPDEGVEADLMAIYSEDLVSGEWSTEIVDVD